MPFLAEEVAMVRACLLTQRSRSPKYPVKILIVTILQMNSHGPVNSSSMLIPRWRRCWNERTQIEICKSRSRMLDLRSVVSPKLYLFIMVAYANSRGK